MVDLFEVRLDIEFVFAVCHYNNVICGKHFQKPVHCLPQERLIPVELERIAWDSSSG